MEKTKEVKDMNEQLPKGTVPINEEDLEKVNGGVGRELIDSSSRANEFNRPLRPKRP